MKLTHLEIENYGMFSDAKLEFDGNSLQVINGPNEAGKSTLLQLIREVTFGFPVRSPYAFSSHVGELAATATIKLTDGRVVRFRRRKGRNNTVVGEFADSKQQVDESGLLRLLGGASSELYQHVFGFSLTELSEAEKSLEHASLNEALYGAGIGGLANFQRVQKSFVDESSDLFVPRGVRRAINQCLKQIREIEAESKSACLKPRDYAQLRSESVSAEAVVNTTRTERDDRRKREAYFDRLARAVEPWHRMNALQQELDEIEPADAFPINSIDTFRSTVEKLQLIDDDISEIQKELANTTSSLAALRLDPDAIEQEAVIRQLVQELGRIRDCRRDIPLRRQEAATIKKGVVSSIADLNPNWGLKDLEEFRTTLAQRDAVEQLDDDISEARQTVRVIEQDLKAARTRLAKEQREYEKLQSVDVGEELAQLCEQSSRHESDRDELQELERLSAAAEVELDKLRIRLSGPVRVGPERLSVVSPPTRRVCPGVRGEVGRFGDRSVKCRTAGIRHSRGNRAT